MKKVFRANLYFLIILLLEIFMPYVLLPIYRAIGIRDVRIALVCNHIIIFIIPAIIYVIITKCNVVETFKFKVLPLKDLIFVIILGFLCVPIMNFFGIISGFFFENNIGNLMTSISSTPYIVLMGIIALMPAITEEITLRGVILSGYSGKSRFKSAVIIGIFFGIFHLDANQFLYAAVLGFILAYAVRVTGSIFTSMIMHFIINGSSVTLQKLMTLIQPDKIDKTSSVSLKTLPLAEKISLLQGSIGMFIVVSVLAFFVIKKLDVLGRRRGVVTVENPEGYRNISGSLVETNERIINLPLIASVIIYILYMSITSMI